MSLIGRRPASLEELPLRRPIPLPRPGDCFYCRATLKTDYDAATHRCDAGIFEARRRFREGVGRVRL